MMERRLRTLAPVAPDIRPPPPLAPGEAVAIAARHHRSGSDGSPLAVPPPLLPRSHHWQPGGSSSSTSISSPILSLSSPLSSPARLSKRGGNGGGSARSNTSGHNGNGNGNNNNNTAVACDPCRKRKCKVCKISRVIQPPLVVSPNEPLKKGVCWFGSKSPYIHLTNSHTHGKIFYLSRKGK